MFFWWDLAHVNVRACSLICQWSVSVRMLVLCRMHCYAWMLILCFMMAFLNMMCMYVYVYMYVFAGRLERGFGRPAPGFEYPAWPRPRDILIRRRPLRLRVFLLCFLPQAWLTCVFWWDLAHVNVKACSVICQWSVNVRMLVLCCMHCYAWMLILCFMMVFLNLMRPCTR